MKELKFTCPSCGQHVQCDPGHSGENVPCPGCAAMIRVPLDGVLTEAPASEAGVFPREDSEKVSYAPAESADGPRVKHTPAHLSTETRPQISLPQPESPDSATAVPAAELHCTCPVCQSELCISVEAEPHSVGVCRTAKLANHGTQSAKDAESAHSAETSQANAEHLSLEERERQIAEAREAHPVSLYPTFKPRLDKILGDDAKEAA